MASRIEHTDEPEQATKMRRPSPRRSLIDDHVGRDRDRRNSAALGWSLGVTYKVLVVQGHTSASPEHLRELHARLFPVKWRGLVNLRDGWIARAFQPLTYADLGPIPDLDELRRGRIAMTPAPAGGLARTMQLGIILGWRWPIHCAERPSLNAAAIGSMTEQERAAYLDTLPAREWTEASATLAEGFRERYMTSERNPAQTWHNRQSRNARAVRELEARINTEGVRVEWSTEPNTEPCFRLIDGERPAVTVAQVVFGG